MSATRRRLQALGVILAVGAVAAFLYLVNPAERLAFAPCPFHALTGFYCPGCGSLRGLHALLHGHLFAAFGLNPLMVLSLPFLAYPFASQVMLATRGRELPYVRWPVWAIKALFWLIVLYWILRNVPLYPFTILAP